MSHITKLQTQFNNLEHLKGAVEIVAKNNNMEVFENNTVQDWQGDVQNEQIAAVGVEHNGIRVAGYIPNEDGSYKLESDFYSTKLNEKQFNMETTQQYTQLMAEDIFSAQGYQTVGTETLSDGTYRITLSN